MEENVICYIFSNSKNILYTHRIYVYVIIYRFQPSDFVVEYTGERISVAEANRREKEVYDERIGSNSLYLFSLPNKVRYLYSKCNFQVIK